MRVIYKLRLSASMGAMLLASVAAGDAAFAQAVPPSADSPAAAPAAAATDTTAAPTAAAPEAPANGEILVTARRRTERLIDVPVAVSVLGVADVKRYATTSLDAVAGLIPQVSIATTGGSGAGAAFSIRGIGSPITDPGLDQSVSINIDNVPISRGRVATQAFFDTESIEVLKGPQALFFGKNSPAGVISLTSAGPTKDLSGYVDAGYEFNARERYVEGAIAGPLGGGFSARLALRADKEDGWLYNDSQPIVSPLTGLELPGASYSRAPGLRQLLGRLTVKYSDGPFDAVLKVFGSSNRGNTDFSQVPLCNEAHPHTLGVVDVQNGCTLGNHVSVSQDSPLSSAGLPGTDGRSFYTRTDSVLSSLSMNYHADHLTVTSNTGYYHYVQRQYGSPGLSFAIPYGTTGEKYSQFTQELRLLTDLGGPINFMLGGYFEDNHRQDNVDINLFPFLGADPATGLFYTEADYAKVHGQTLSAFGQAIVKLRSDLELTGGLRYTHERKSSVQANTFVNANDGAYLPLIPVGELLIDNPTFNNVSPEATLTYHPTRQSTLYAAFKTGYKSGGVASPNTLSTDFLVAANRNFSPEKAIGGEIGAKGQLLNGRLRANATIYSYTFKNLQVASFNSETTTFEIRNAAKAKTNGVEVDANFRATDSLTLRGSGAYNHGRYTSFPDAPCPDGAAAGCLQDLKGSQLPRAPDWNFSGGFTITQPVGDDMKVSLDGDAITTSSYWLQQDNDPLSRQKGFVRLNATLRLSEKDDRYQLAFIGLNLTNKYYGVISYDLPFGNPGELAVTEGRPREFMLQGTVHF